MQILRSFYLRQVLLALAHALSLLFALSPFDLWPLGVVAVAAVVAAAAGLYRAPARRIVLTWIVFAFATTFIAFGWIVATIHRYTGERPLLSFALALAYALLFQLKFVGIFTLARYVDFGALRDAGRMLAIAAFFAITEYLAPELFPWSWGNAVASSGWLRQLAAIGSVYFVSLAAVFISLLCWQILWVDRDRRFAVRLRSQVIALLLAITGVVTGGLLYYWPLQPEAGKLRTLVIQTNIGAAPEQKRSDHEFATDAINRLFNQSIEGAILHSPLDLVVWPEASMPFHSADASPTNRGIYSPTFDAAAEYTSRRTGAALVFQDMFQAEVQLFSRLATRPDVGMKNYYLKRRLVPWGEFLPFGDIWPSLRNVFPEAGRYRAAEELNEITLQTGIVENTLRSRQQIEPELAFLTSGATVRQKLPQPRRGRQYIAKPAICYEALYPADVRTRDAQLILNLASDAWFGDGIEGHQHASAAVLRAVENGVPIVRAAMSGVTVIADAKGDDIVARSMQNRAQIVFAEIALERRQTVFSRFGMSAFWALALACLWPALLGAFISARTAKNR
ncbi:MAG: apolipoprotein N-acyltransferase [Spirochaetota bacterium]